MKVKLIRVAGNSMEPSYADRDYVLSFARCRTQYKPGDVVIANHPRYHTIIKRIVNIDSDGHVLLAGDHPSSTSSEQLGWLPQSALYGRVVWHIPAK